MLSRSCVKGDQVTCERDKLLPPARDFAAWCERHADIDAVILAWLRAQVPQRAPASFS